MFLFALSLYSTTLHVILCYGAVTFGSTCNILFLADDYQEAHYIPLKISSGHQSNVTLWFNIPRKQCQRWLKRILYKEQSYH